MSRRVKVGCYRRRCLRLIRRPRLETGVKNKQGTLRSLRDKGGKVLLHGRRHPLSMVAPIGIEKPVEGLWGWSEAKPARCPADRILCPKLKSVLISRGLTERYGGVASSA